MNVIDRTTNPFRVLACTATLLAVVFATGCQVDINGQTLPSGTYLKDDVQYFAPGPAFKLQREAAAMKAAKGEAEVTDQP